MDKGSRQWGVIPGKLMKEKRRVTLGICANNYRHIIDCRNNYRLLDEILKSCRHPEHLEKLRELLSDRDFSFSFPMSDASPKHYASPPSA